MTAGSSAPVRVTRLFVDELGEASARLLRGDDLFSFPVALLPEGVREGDWVELSVALTPPPPSDSAERRKRLVRDDPGGTIKL